MASQYVKIVVFVPESHADTVREAMGKAGAGKIGNYSFCSFSSKGIGRFMPEKDAHPAVGKVGQHESVLEERIEMRCDRAFVQRIVTAVKEVHPYEEVVLDVYSLEEV